MAEKISALGFDPNIKNKIVDLGRRIKSITFPKEDQLS